jgi:hypothetical protein
MYKVFGFEIYRLVEHNMSSSRFIIRFFLLNFELYGSLHFSQSNVGTENCNDA